MKKKALSYEEELPKELRSYQRSQSVYASRDFTKTNITVLEKAMGKSKVVYLGDFHTFDQNSKNVERILKSLLDKSNSLNEQLAIGVEFVQYHHQSIVDSFLSGVITELEFLEMVGYQQSWRFPWNHYRKFFMLARTHNLKVLALNSTGTLTERDDFASRLISDYINLFPKSKLLVLFGEYHIVKNKLPLKVNKKLPQDFKSTIIHQNLDNIYWKTIHMDKVPQIIKFDDYEFAIQTSPPWVKYESMIYWYENLLEDPDFDLHEYIVETGRKSLSVNATDNFFYMCGQIITTLNLAIEKKLLENFQLLDERNLNSVVKKINSLKSPGLVNLFNFLISNSKGFKVPNSSYYYCPNYSFNRLSFLCGQHVFSILREQNESNIEDILFKRNNEEKFIFFIYSNFFSYFSSKIINPFRKCNLIKDIWEILERNKLDPLKRKSYKLTLEFFDKDIIEEKISSSTDLRINFHTAKTIGNIMADLYYDNVYQQGQSSINEILNLILNEDLNRENLNTLLQKSLPKNFKKYQKRYF